MRKAILISVSLAVLGGLIYMAATLKPRPDETKTMAEPETTVPVPVENDDFTVPELEEFDADIDSLDQSINQL